MTDLVAVGSDLLAPYQPSQRYHLLDGARVAHADLPADNLVSALIDLERTRDAARLREALQALSSLLRAQGDDHLTQAFVTWLHQGLRVAGPLPAGEGHPLTRLQETQTMLEENVREWPASPTPSASRRLATGSSSVPRRQSCSPASAATTGRAAEAQVARTGRRRGIGVERRDERAAVVVTPSRPQ